MGSNKHAQERVKSDRTTPPSGADRRTDADHALRAGHDGTSQRKQAPATETSRRDAGSDDRRSGSESGKS